MAESDETYRAYLVAILDTKGRVPVVVNVDIWMKEPRDENFETNRPGFIICEAVSFDNHADAKRRLLEIVFNDPKYKWAIDWISSLKETFNSPQKDSLRLLRTGIICQAMDLCEYRDTQFVVDE